MKWGLHVGRWIHFRQPFTIFGWVILACLVFFAVHDTSFDWDARAYHLPFARGVWGLPDDHDYDLPPDLEALSLTATYYYSLGFPKVAEVFQGFFWIICGSASATTLPQILLFLAYLYVVRLLFRLPLSLVIVACAACPLFFIHFLGIYVDLFANLNLAIGFLLLSNFVYNLTRSDSPLNPWFIYGSGTLILAANSKTMALIVSLFFLGIFGARILLHRNVSARSKVKLLGSVALVVICCLAFPIKNYLEYKNPLYPIQVDLNGHVLFVGPVSNYRPSPDYKTSVLNCQPVEFLLSVTELDYSIRQVPTVYNIDSNSGDHPRFNHPARTGGFGGFYFILLIVAFASGFYRYRSLPRSFTKHFLIDALLLIAFASILPQSFELRYWLFIPLLLVPIGLKLCLVNRAMLQTVKILLGVILVYNWCLIYISLHSGFF